MTVDNSKILAKDVVLGMRLASRQVVEDLAVTLEAIRRTCLLVPQVPVGDLVMEHGLLQFLNCSPLQIVLFRVAQVHR
jgi:hypothetical protein